MSAIRRAAVHGVGMTTLLLAGCAGYERRDLDVNATREAWLARTADNESVLAFAKKLSEQEHVTNFDPHDGLTLAEGEVVALVFNPDLRIARLEANVAKAGEMFAGLWEDPVLGVDMERVVRGAEGANPWVVGGTVELTLPLSGRLDAAKSHASAVARAELDRVAAKEWATRAALRELWLEWSAAQHRAEVGKETVERSREVSDIAELQKNAGVMSRTDARLFAVELASKDADLIGLNAHAKELELQVRAMMGLPASDTTELVASLVLESTELDEDALRAQIEATNPELAAVRAQYEVAEQALRTEVRKQYPDLVIGPGLATDRGDDRVLLGIRLPLSLWNRNQKGVAEADAKRETARGLFDTTYEQLASRLAIALLRFRAGREQREAIERSVVPLADDQLADVRKIAELGRVEPLMLLEAIKTQHEARIRLIDARLAEAVGMARVRELIGPTTQVSQKH